VKAPVKVKEEPTFEHHTKINGGPILAPLDGYRKPRHYTGRDVIVACLGWGADPFHDAFRKKDGSTRFLYFWDQSEPMRPDKPNPYGYGIISSREEIDRALKEEDPYSALGYHPAKADPDGTGAHDCHTLDIAAGSRRVTPQGEIQGVAPDADLIFVHLAGPKTIGTFNLGDSVGVLEGIDFVAKSAGDRPWVINMSLGRHGGSHDGRSPLERGIDNLLSSTLGCSVIMSTGNYQKGRTHTHGRLRPGSKRTVGWLINPEDITPNELEIWYGERDIFKVSVTLPGGSQRFDANLGQRVSILFNGTEVGKIYHRECEPNSGQRHAEIRLYAGAPAGHWKITIQGIDVVDGRHHVWIEKDKGTVNQSRLDENDATQRYTINSICNGTRTIAVGGFDSTTSERCLAPFSSCGPTRDGRQKPDVLAPAVRVLAARSTPAGSHQPISSALTEKSGTSMAAPHVTGCVALIFEAANRKLTISETQEIIISTAEKVTENYNSVDSFDSTCIGDGYLNIDAALSAVTELTRQKGTEIDHDGDLEQPIIAGVNNLLPKAENILSEPLQENMAITLSQGGMFINDKLPNGPNLGNEGVGEEDISSNQSTYGHDNLPEDEILSSLRFNNNYHIPEEDQSHQYALNSVPGQKIIEIANEYILSNYDLFRRSSVLGHVLKKVGVLEGKDVSLYYNLSPRIIFYYFANGNNHRYGSFEDVFEVVARPGQLLSGELRTGDILIRVILGTSSELVAFIVSPELLTYEELSNASLTGERGDRCGRYSRVIEAGSKRYSLQDSFHRIVLDCSGRIPENQLILRIRTSDMLSNQRSESWNHDLEESLPNEVKRWFIDTIPYTDGNNVTQLIDGRQTFESMVDSIRTATSGSKGHFIYFANWRMDLNFQLIPGKAGTSMKNLIMEADKNGVEVRALLSNDLLGNFENSRNLTDQHYRLFGFQLAHGSFIADNNFLPLGLHHQKILIVKGSKGLIGFCGGIDIASNRLDNKDIVSETLSEISSENLNFSDSLSTLEESGSGDGDNQLGSQHDVHCRIEGPAACHLLDVFCKRWEDHPNKPYRSSLLGRAEVDRCLKIAAEMSGQVQTKPGNMVVQIGCTFGNGNVVDKRSESIKDAINRVKSTTRNLGGRVGWISLGGSLAGLILGRYAGGKAADIYLSDYTSAIFTKIKSAKGNRNYYEFAPNGSQDPLNMISNAIQNARKYIYLEDQYMISLNIAKRLNLQISSNKDLKVIILTSNSSITTDLFMPFTLRAEFIKTLTGGRYPHEQIAVCYRKVDRDHNYVHAKTWIFDDEYAIIGSANCNNRGYTHDSEVVAGIYDRSSSQIFSMPFPKALRISLWSEHLRISRSKLESINSTQYWFNIPDLADVERIPVDHLAVRDGQIDITKPIKSAKNLLKSFVVSTGQVDPRGDR
jgi:phosphatidylserine/phosphatidylglycerophosphate/cardiolipin synthase-like enzyme/subtilisin family serine protease